METTCAVMCALTVNFDQLTNVEHQLSKNVGLYLGKLHEPLQHTIIWYRSL